MHPAPLLPVHEVAIRLSVAEDTVITWAQNGTLPTQIVDGTYRFRSEDIAAYANAHPDPDPAGDGQVNDLIRSPDGPAPPR
jgi:excisionase family DNA binding protein